ncbi:ABC transporter ATP-binding protein [Devosia faecipullorum]|uniref:ABC transporter ATP-binding protein n=1 Tax=Devosia faecipullorum TaxID=2755039 RepID=UPI00187B3071|nr:ABC transporter ATP-binding protein [Devosia faecipullorum]MBE7733325.1 ABC transporter ATP-binding protein [Devosia faecipullorum]
MTALLEVSDIRKSFFALEVLKGVSLTIEEGTITGIIGPNGAGKSTFFNTLAGELSSDSGSIRFAGEDITRRSSYEVARRGMVRSFQISRGFPNLTVMESLLVYGSNQPGEKFWPALLGTKAARQREDELVEKARGIAEKLRLSHVLNNLATQISGGQKKLLEIGRALMADPRLILLDEPMAGVNPSLGNEIGEQIRALNAEGYTFVIIEHDMSWVGKLCNPVIVLADGKVLTQGTFDEVISDPRVQDVYMGIDA